MHLMSASLFLMDPLYSFSQRLHTEERQTIRNVFHYFTCSFSADGVHRPTSVQNEDNEFNTSKNRVNHGLYASLLPSKEGKPADPTIRDQAKWTVQ